MNDSEAQAVQRAIGKMEGKLEGLCALMASMRIEQQELRALVTENRDDRIARERARGFVAGALKLFATIVGAVAAIKTMEWFKW